MEVLELMKEALSKRASDLHFTVASPPVMRIDGELVRVNDQGLTHDDLVVLVGQVLDAKQIALLDKAGEIDISYSVKGYGRFRVNVYRQRGSYAMALRVVNLNIPTFEELGLPESLHELARRPRGLVLVTGPTGSGKSTTLAAMVGQINRERNCHIITLEDPIEYLHHHGKSIVNQREINSDTHSFGNGLRSALREDPDVILVGEMRDLETISIAITAAETGHLVFSTLHTMGAANTIDRIIDVFPPYQQQQVRVQLAAVMEGIISQQLIPKSSGAGRVGAFEVMLANNAIRNLTREGKTHQIMTSIQTGQKMGMQTMDSALVDLFRRGIITEESVLTRCVDLEQVKKDIRVLRGY